MTWILLVMACSQPVAVPEAAPAGPLALARLELHRVEIGLLRAEAERRLQAGNVEQAAAPLLAAERLSGLPDLNGAALELAGKTDRALATQLHAALADAMRSDASRAAGHHREALKGAAAAEIRARYAEGLEGALPRVAGVHAGMVEPALALAAAQHVQPPERAELDRAGGERLRALAQLLGTVEVSTVEQAVAAGIPESIAASEYVEGALAGFDEWTRVAWPAELGGWEAHHSGVTVGVGLVLAPDATVQSLTVRGPAFEAGVHIGDRLLAVLDGETRTEAQAGVDALTAALIGDVDSPLVLVLERGGESMKTQLTRRAVRAVTVHGWTRDAQNDEVLAIEGQPGVGYLRVEAFRPYTDESARALLEAADGLEALVIDLRGNGGGDVQAAANFVDLFAGEGIVASLQGPGAPPPPAEGEIAWNALVAGDPWEALPLAVLIDRDSASAAELAAGALALRDGVVLIGERSFGKGWSQGLELHPEHGFALQVTNAAWYLPNGQGIQRIHGAESWGVEPDVALVESAAESWQNRARREALEAPVSHADGSPMPRPDPGHREGLPVLEGDPAVERALFELRKLR